MTATTSGTTLFDLDVDDIIESAMEPLGGEWASGVEYNKARRTLNLILIQLQNKNIPLNKIEFVDQTVTDGTSDYVLNGDISDVLQISIQDPSDTDGLEIPIERWGLKEYHEIPNKSTENRPTVFTIDRNKSAVTLKLWPTPDKTYTCKMLVAKRLEDITASYQKIDISYRYLPLITKWLSYELSLTKDGISPEKIVLLKNALDEVMPDTFDEDRERVDMFIVPGGISGK